MMVAFDANDVVKIVTIHPIKKRQKESWIKSRRWIEVKKKWK